MLTLVCSSFIVMTAFRSDQFNSNAVKFISDAVRLNSLTKQIPLATKSLRHKDTQSKENQ